jgi:hypothetical protein
MWAPSVPLTESKIMSYSKPVDMNSRLPNQITVERRMGEMEVAIQKQGGKSSVKYVGSLPSAPTVGVFTPGGNTNK